MTEPFVRDENFHALMETMRRSRRPLALLGAGTSVASGYPDWSGLLDALNKKATAMSPKYRTLVRELNDPAWQAEEYRRIIGEPGFCEVLTSQFGPRGQVGEALQIISQLGFRHLLTTNYDPCIEHAYAARGGVHVLDWSDEAGLRRFFVDLSADPPQPYLLYLHGRYGEPEKVILTESSYAGRYMRSDDARNKLFAIFLTQPVVFIGFSVNDPDLNHLMREVNARLGSGTPRHFALMGYEVEDERELIRSRFLGKYGIAPVFYQLTRTRTPDGKKTIEDHGHVVDLLAAIHQELHGRPPQVSRVERAPSFADTAPEQPAALPLDPLDEQKGRWGGQEKRNGRVLSVRDVAEKIPGQVLTFNLVVESTPDAGAPLEGEVIFHLHQTFHPRVQPVPVQNGRAVLKIVSAYGAFTVGAQADGRATALELDLARTPHPDLPDWFRER